MWTAGFTWPTHNLLVKKDVRNPDPSTWQVVPDLATSWEQPDDTSYVFQLADANFHDIAPVSGRPVNSEDVKFMIEHMSTQQPQFFRQHEFADATVETPDEKTAVIKFPTPQAPFWNRITIPGTMVLPVEVQDTEGLLSISGNPVPGTGPFIHDTFLPDEKFNVVRNPDYFKPDLPYLDAINNDWYPNIDARFVAFRAKNIDTMNWGVSLDYCREAQGMAGVSLDTRVGVCCPQWIQFNPSKPPFDDVRVRRAISLTLPRQEIVKVAYSGEELAVMIPPGGLNSFVHGTATYSPEELKQLPGYRIGADRDADIAEAKRLLEAAGVTEWEGTIASVANFGAHVDTSWILRQDAFKEIGFQFNLRAEAYSNILVLLASREFDVLWTCQCANGTDPNQFLEFYFAPGRGAELRGLGKPALHGDARAAEPGAGRRRAERDHPRDGGHHRRGRAAPGRSPGQANRSDTRPASRLA